MGEPASIPDDVGLATCQEALAVSVPSTQLSPGADAARQTYPFTLSDLPYAYDALEPHLDQKTLQVHHRGHHATYVKKLNEALARHPDLHALTLGALLGDLARVPDDIRTAVKNNGGGHLNHDVFWNSMAPAAASPVGRPQGPLAEAIDRDFGSFDAFRKKFSELAGAHFASGWVALGLDRATRKLIIADLKDHEVLQPGAQATLLIIDVWEHAYYVKFQNRRPEFIAAFWNVANWRHVAEVFELATALR
jgi:Fe-Mn family superoxide dismutase